MSGLEEGSGRVKRVCVRKGYQLVDRALKLKEKVGGEEEKEGRVTLGDVIQPDPFSSRCPLPAPHPASLSYPRMPICRSVAKFRADR